MLTRKQPRPDNAIDVPTYQPAIGEITYFISGSPAMTVTALVKDEKNIPWAAECGWFNYNNDYVYHTFNLKLLCDGSELIEDEDEGPTFKLDVS